MKLLISTKNKHKVKEISEIFSSSTIMVEPFKNMPNIEETGKTFEENAILKAISLSKLVDSYVIADDSGLSVKALNNAPGIYSARYAGEQATDYDNNNKLLTEMEHIKDRSCKYICCIALAKGAKLLGTFYGEVDGTIGYELVGDRGFGYDPLFILPNKLSMAQLSSKDKNQISHRKIALEKLFNYFNNLG